ncbi:Ppx/GppA phosphatase family protein [Albibacterium indicum]|uniref:Ppx/GppA phosphatase family protein n=1 Tax=Albibacterium indicum TaxID=2292082 RepID=UPI000E4862EE|nr:ethanolamine ammonia-lyase reactivating factor EutA [Pedobacter indicus]
MRYAAIDIGSNAVRLLISDISKSGNEYSFNKDTLVRVPLRLGDDAFLDHKISDKKSELLVKTMIAFRNLMDAYEVKDYMACATSAMREAKNGQDLVKKIEAVGIDLKIIDGEEEAKIIYSNQLVNKLDSRKTYLYIDVGGGSTELSILNKGKVEASKSFNIGTIRILDNQDKEETWVDMKKWVRDHTKEFKNVVGVGSGGNINKLFSLSNEKPDNLLSYEKLKALSDYLNSYSLKERIQVLGLKPDRADVIIPACLIFISIMKWGKLKKIAVPRIGLVDGVIQTLIDKNLKS